MSYLVIARKYRPQKFEEIIGQDHIARTLRNAIGLDKISHAYLFSGPRGIGKTTTARILAKAVNCTGSDDVEPCNECTICTEITRSESVDVIEIDAASNRGIEEIRQLRENVKFAPARNRYKVYIIDEVHMLTKEAFNALLKTLEEPPDHAIFIMATTEPEKVLDTITSRCQTFNFKLISEKLIKEALQEIAAKEKAEYEEEGLWLIARASGGSMRDAQSIMDQVLSYSENSITAHNVREILGLIPRDVLFEYAECIAEGRTKEALELTDRLVKEGFSLTRLFNELLNHFRNMMLVSVMGKSSEMLGFSSDYAGKLAAASKNFTRERIVWILEFLTNNISRMKYADNPHVVIDTILFKLCQKYVGFDEISKLIGGAVSSEGTAAKEAPAEIEEADSGNEEKAPEPEAYAEPIEEEQADDAEHEEPAEEEEDHTSQESSRGRRWEKILLEIKKESQPLYHALNDAKATLKGKRIIIRYGGLLELTQRQEQILKANIIKVMGDEFYPEIVRTAQKKSPDAEIEDDKEKKRVVTPAHIEDEEPVVGRIVELFKGRVEK